MENKNAHTANEDTQAQPKGSSLPARPAVYIRMTPDEYESVQIDSKASGMTVPDLLKSTYFSKKRVTLLMSREDAKTILVQLSRIGNNMNQIAKLLNSGFRHGFNEDLVKVKRDLEALWSFMVRKSGGLKPAEATR